MALTPQLEKISQKSSGIYFFEFDKSQIITSNNEILRLVIGVSKKGPFNTPIYVPNTEYFTDVFGTIDRALERKKSYFHRTCLNALETGPIIVLNLLRLNDVEDVVNNFMYSTSATEANIGLNSQKYSGYFNTEKFWQPNDDAFLKNIENQPTSNRLFNLVNIGQKPFSVIVRKTNSEELVGFNLTAKEWFGVDQIPEYLHEEDLISDFFVDVIVIGGDYGPQGTLAPYERYSTDPTFSQYFDKVKGLKRKLIASDAIDTSVDQFLSLPEVNNIATYKGCLLPDFIDKNGNNLFIENSINKDSARTGLYCAINKEIFAEGEILSGIDGGLDLIGHNIYNAQPTAVDFLSYKDTVKSDLQYNAALPSLSTMDLTSVAITDLSSGNVSFTISKSTNEAAYNIASSFVANENLPRVIGTYVQDTAGTKFGALINLIITATTIYFEVDSLTSADFIGATEISFLSPSDLNFVYDDTFVQDTLTIGRIVGAVNSTLYQDALSGTLTNGDKVFFGTGGTIPGYLTFNFGEELDSITYATGMIETNCPIASPLFQLPAVYVVAYETGELTTPILTFNFSVNFYTSAGVEILTDTLVVQTLKGALNISCNVTRTSLANEVEVSYAEGSKIDVNKYVLSDDGAITGNSRLTKVYKVINTGTNLRVITYGKMKIFRNNNQDSIQVFTPITEWIDYYTLATLSGFSYTSYHLPNGTNTQQNNILYDTLSGTALYKALIDRENIAFRYIVDTFGNGIEPNSKAIFAKMAKDRGDCIALLNAPSYKEFKESTDPVFTDIYGAVDARMISMGGDLTKNPQNIYSLPTISQGSNYCAFFGPYIKVSDNDKVITVPPASYVSNLFIDKHNTAFAWSYVAGPKRGVISGRGVVGVETNLSKEDRDYLEPFGYNPIIFQTGVGILIYGDKTAQQNIKSALSSIHVREVLIHIMKGLEDVLKYFIFEFNTPAVRLQIKSLADAFLNRVKQSNGLYDFKTIMDDSNNTPDVIDRNMGILDVYVEPVRGLEILVNRVTVLKTGAIASGNFQ